MLKEKSIVLESIVPAGRNKLSDYTELGKLRLLMLVLITTGIGFYLSSWQGQNFLLLFNVLLGTGCVGAGANSLNQWYEQDVDARMRRTKNRPIPSGRISSDEALRFGMVISLIGLSYLAVTVNWLTTILGFLTWSSYLFIYTPLKQKTVLNTWIGAVPGALPPLMGWTAARGTLELEALTLFAILYFWQLPHFFAISWMYRDDYRNGNFRMLSLDDPTGKKTSYQIFVNTLLLLIASLSVFFTNQAGIFYLVSAAGLGCLFLMTTVLFFKEKSVLNAKRVFIASIVYFPVLWFVMILEQIFA
ncbi:MAG: protoheme IX farnesyltransferase [SAR324 cluster bacterium]|nr:protoheme IX farnesyltransferase [SAR324 cluster bacterium]